METAKQRTFVITNYRMLRAKLRLNQDQFWSRVGVTQSGGSRYEAGRNVPAPTKAMVDMAYGTKKEALSALARLRGVTVDELTGKASTKKGSTK